ncbi:MAG: DinB family protein, partial [Phaeodactylibacter sp.]|nr:DinB family protein [Phaeodactylibacter sp.]
MKISTQQLIRQLSTQTEAHIERALLLQELDDKTLNFKPDSTSWSILECLEHLNRYGDFYLPEVERQLL